MAATGTRVEPMTFNPAAGTYTASIVNDGRFTWSLIMRVTGAGTTATYTLNVSTDNSTWVLAASPTALGVGPAMSRVTFSNGGSAVASSAGPNYPPISEPYIQVQVVVVGTYTSVQAWLVGASIS